MKQLEKLSKEQKVEERAERRQAKREQYEKFLRPEPTVNAGGEEADEDLGGEERAFDDGSKRQTVRVTTIRTEDEDEEFEARLERKKKALEAAKVSTDDKGIIKKMTKKGMSVLTNTKMKLMGKHRFDGAKRKKKDTESKGGPAGKGNAVPKRKGQKRKGRK